MATKSGKVLVGTALCLVTDELEDYPRKIELAWRRPPVTHRGDQPTGYLPPRASELKSRTGERYSTGEDLSRADGPVINGVNGFWWRFGLDRRSAEATILARYLGCD